MPGTRRHGRFRCLLHPSDFSPASRAAFAEAVALAKAYRARLLLAHAIEPWILMPDVAMAARTFDELQRALRLRAEDEIGRLARTARRAGIPACETVVTLGVPATVITRLAKSRRADAIVMGTHGLTGLARLLTGSVAARVIATAPCPVITVRSRG